MIPSTQTMKRAIYCLIFLLSFSSHAQQAFNLSGAEQSAEEYTKDFFATPSPARKLIQRNHGVLIGLQRGQSTAIEFGGEAHWRKLALVKPHIMGATGGMEYNFGDHVVGYKAGMWMKRGRINFTYGGNVVYFNDFKGLQRFGAGPAVGFRFAGFHLVNGYNFLGGDKELDKVNSLYMSMRYYFPLKNSFTWDKKTMKRKKQREKERARKKKDREKEKEGKEKKTLREILQF
jgi:hypothetical protein